MEKLKPENTGGSWGLTDELARLKIENINPATIVDFGAGLGKYGFMIRDIFGKRKTIAIEVFKDSVEWLREQYLYDEVVEIDLVDWFDGKKYDLGIFGDVLEHLYYKDILLVLKNQKKAEIFKYIMIVVPLDDCPQDECGGNEAEIHKAVIDEDTFVKDIKDMGYRITHKYVVSADGPDGEYKKMLLIIK
jgi:hypothetical protein